MITLNFEKASAWVAFIVGIITGIVVGFLVQPYIMEAVNNSLYPENQALKDKIVQLEQQLSKLSEDRVQSPNPPLELSHHRQTFNGVEITLLSCSDAISEPGIACQFTVNQPYDFIIIYAYGTVLKAQQNVISHADSVQATDYEVSTLKTDTGEISSWKFLTPTTVPFTVRFGKPSDVVASSVELFVKPDQGASTTVKFFLSHTVKNQIF
ncbi:MAG: hypothetical protein ABFS56_25055 [Pseudomonadota bacterium]